MLNTSEKTHSHKKIRSPDTVLYPKLLDEIYKSFLHFKSDNNILLSFIMDYRLQQ